jgi:hypothetical protein
MCSLGDGLHLLLLVQLRADSPNAARDPAMAAGIATTVWDIEISSPRYDYTTGLRVASAMRYPKKTSDG